MTYAFMIEPDFYTPLHTDEERIEKCQEWGLLSDKATKLKTFYYKGNGLNVPCTIVGFVDHMAAVIQLDNDQKHCIHPAYLKEMQASGFKGTLAAAPDKKAGTSGVADSSETSSIESSSDDGLVSDAESSDSAGNNSSATEEQPSATDRAIASTASLPGDPDGLVEEYVAPQSASASEDKPKAKTASKAKAAKIDLPEGKVKMTAVVKEFTTVPNHFADNDDEVIIYEAVAILEPDMLEVGEAWSSHSATIKKLDLEIGDTLTFDAKIIKKKLAKHPVPYKINNPSKIQKQ